MDLYRLTVLGLVLSAGGCEHKSQRDDQGTTNVATPKLPGDELPAEPVGREPIRQPSPDPTPAAGAVRPPVAGDLADYTKDIGGSGKLMATIDTSMGTFHCELFGDKAPMTVANFIGLATGKKSWMNPKTGNVEKGTPFFDGLTFHRVISGFMIQGGDPMGRGIGGPGYNFADEIDRSLTMGPGALAMANAGPGPDGGGTNGSQFFIMEGSRPDLVGHHTIFGQCKEVDLVKKITGVSKDGEDKPDQTVSITKVTIGKT